MSRKPLVPSLGRHAGTGQARVLINGRHLYLGKYGSPEAEEKYRRLVAELLAGKPAASVAEPAAAASLTVNELVLAYWRHAERYYRKNGEATSELSTFKTPLRTLRRLYGSTPAAEFGPTKLKAVREALLRGGDEAVGGAKARGQCRSTANRSVGRIRRVFA